MSVIKIIGAADGRECIQAGRYLRDMDFEAFDGRGLVTTTLNREEAKRFVTTAHAMKFWNTVSVTRPIRPDGKPNKPLTAFHIEILS